MRDRLTLGPMLLLLGVLLSGGPLVAAPSDLVNIRIETNPLVAGQQFAFTIRLHDNGLAVPTAVIPPLNPRISLVGGPEISTETETDETGRQGRFVFMRYTARANTAGYVELPAVTVQYGVQTLKTRPVLLAIARQDSGFVPPDLVWTVHADRIVKGQSVFISLDLVNCATISFPETLDVPALIGGAFEEVRETGRIESYALAGRSFQSVPLTGFMFTPSAAGTIALPLARVMLNKQPIQTMAQTIQVSPLPPGAEGIAAIGDLRLSASLESDRVAPGSSTRLSVRIEGTGNLKYLQLPVPVTEGVTLGEKTENSKLVPIEAGYRGYREAVYRLEASEAGKYTVTIPELAVLGLDGRIVYRKVNGLTLKVGPVDPAIAGRQVSGPKPLLAIDRLVIHGIPADDQVLQGWKSLVEAGLSDYASRDYVGANSKLLKALRQAPANAGLLYDIGIVCEARGSPALAIFHWQRATRLAPWESLFRNTLQEAEKSMGLNRQMPTSVLPPLAWMVGSGLAGLALAIAGLVLWHFRRRTIMWIVVALGLGLAGVSLSGLVAQGVQAGQPVAVVCETGAVIKRIPETGARDWLGLSSGMSLLVLGRSGDFVLVETAFGIKGWVDHSTLYLPDDPALL